MASRGQQVRRAARAVASGTDPRAVAEEELRRYTGSPGEGGGAAGQTSSGGEDRPQEESMDPADFPAAREQAGDIDTVMSEETVPLDEAGEALNRSRQEREGRQKVHAICPMVIPRGRSFLSMLPVSLLLVVGIIGTSIAAATSDATGIGTLTHPLFGVHYWVMSLGAVAFVWWRQGMVMVPDGSQALITRFGKLEKVVGPGRVVLISPFKRVSYIVNTTREYPFNAPVREAPTRGGVKASIDLFIQFRISDPEEFVYTLGAVRG